MEDQIEGQQVFLRADISVSWVVPLSAYGGEISEPSEAAAYEQCSWEERHYSTEDLLALAKQGQVAVRFSSEAVESERV